MSQKSTSLEDMQEMLAHHEKTIEDLSTQLADQWQIVSQMENKLSVLTRRFVSLEENSLPTPEITKPPHY